jgi:hypothetical protein
MKWPYLGGVPRYQKIEKNELLAIEWFSLLFISL